MGNEQLLARRQPRRDDRNGVEYPELTGEGDRELQPDRVQRMFVISPFIVKFSCI